MVCKLYHTGSGTWLFTQRSQIRIRKTANTCVFYFFINISIGCSKYLKSWVTDEVKKALWTGSFGVGALFRCQSGSGCRSGSASKFGKSDRIRSASNACPHHWYTAFCTTVADLESVGFMTTGTGSGISLSGSKIKEPGSWIPDPQPIFQRGL